MQAVILAGGLGTRISEETHLKPKPMIEIGGKPIIWHIMKIYSHYGIKNFIICCGYKGYKIKEYFANYALHLSDITFHIDNDEIEIHKKLTEDWKVTLVDTGEKTSTGGRLKRIKKYINGTFCMTYGDGVGDINIKDLIDFHNSHDKIATLTCVIPPARWGSLKIEGDSVTDFQEKPSGNSNWINGGFFVLEPKALDLIDNDECIWEEEPLKNLVRQKQLKSFKHNGFWRPMDTLRDKNYLENLWHKKEAPWKKWI